MRFTGTWALLTELEKDLWHSLKTWGYGPTLEMAVHEEAYFILYFQVQGTAGRVQSRKLMPKGKNCSEIGRIPSRRRVARLNIPPANLTEAEAQIEPQTIIHWRSL